MSQTIGVIGAGTMGAGIAQLAASGGARVLLHDPVPEALEKGAARARKRLGEDAQLETVSSLEAFKDCDVVIEAAPENLELKRELFGGLARDVVSEKCVLASNTSSLSVAAIAATIAHPERVVGLHFFNPPPVMKLVELVAGDDSADWALEAAAAWVPESHTVINARDMIGFLVNRCNRPFLLEALRLVSEGVATVDQIDRICRMSGGYRMGPFELSDLVGVDVGHAVAKSFWEQSFHEPRWRPSVLMQQLVDSGRHGRKSGRGWHEYNAEGKPVREADPAPLETGGGDGRVVVVAGESAHADALLELAADAGFETLTPMEAEGADVPWLLIDAGPAGEDDPPLQGGPQVVLCDVGPLRAIDPEGASAGFYCPLPLGSLVELTRAETTSEAAVERATEFFNCLGKHVEWVGDAPGLVLGRIVCQLVNEACFAVGEGVGSPEDVDAGMRGGLNHPRGPFAWAESLGFEHVATVLGALWDEYREERYRLAPALPRFEV